MMTVLFGSDKSPTGLLKCECVDKVYISVTPKNDKFRYIRFDNLRGVITPSSNVGPDNMTVYVVEFTNGVEPLVLPTEDYLINVVVDNKLRVHG